MIKKNKNFGVVFWITGLSGSGKTTLAKKIYNYVKKKFGPTIVLSGDDLRNIFLLKGYSKKDRLKISMKYSKFCKIITKQNINIIFATIGMFDELREINKKQFKNYCEIYIKSNIKKIEKFEKKKIYKTNTRDIWGKDLRPELPKNPHIIIKNNFKKNINNLAIELKNKISDMNKK